MFTSGMRESSEKVLTIDDAPAAAMKALVSFIYSGEVPVDFTNNIDSCSDLLKVADRYEVTSLAMQCSASLAEMIEIKTVCKLVVVADSLSKKVLRARCIQFM